jgi:hypothetical protein
MLDRNTAIGTHKCTYSLAGITTRVVVDAQILAYAMSADTMLKWANSFAQQYETHT